MTMREQHIGQRIRYYREQAGLTQEELARRIDKTQGYVSLLESGVKPVNSRRLLGDLAATLSVDVENLIGPPSHDPSAAERALRSAVPQVRAALDGALRMEPTAHPDELHRDVQAVLSARMTCNYDMLGQLLPTTLARALHTRLVHPGSSTSNASMMCVSASLALRPIGYVDLAGRLAERAWRIAKDSESPTELAAAAYAMAQCHLSGGTTGLREASMNLAAEMAEQTLTQPDLHAERPALWSWAVMLRLQAALAAATLGDTATANDQLREAANAAQRVQEDSWLMEPTEANVGVWEVAVRLEAGDPGHALMAAQRTRPEALRTTQRQAHLLTHAGRAYAEAGKHEEAAVAYLRADELAPAEVRWRRSVKESVAAMLTDARRRAGSENLRTLAVKVGVDPLGVG